MKLLIKKRVLSRTCKKNKTLTSWASIIRFIASIWSLKNGELLFVTEHIGLVNVRYKYFKVGLSSSKKNLVICFNESPLNMVKNAFLFHLKSSFRFEGIYVFIMSFWSCRKSGLIRKKVNFKIHDVTTWLTNICNTHIAQYLTK